MRRSVAVVAVWMWLAGCASGSEAAAPSGLALVRADSLPTLEIGKLEGDPDYTFESVAGTAHLPSGALVVADRGANRVSIFAKDGTAIRHFGRAGGGPGEFKDMIGVWVRGDTIEAADGELRNILVFDSAGAYVRQFPAVQASRDSLFPIDSWLHGRFWVQGARDADARVAVRAALDRLPPPPRYRLVRVADDGSLWLREPERAADGMRAWLVTDPAGKPSRMVELPDRFDPLEMRGGSVSGRWLGDSDVNFVRVYSIPTSGASAAATAWLTPHAATSAPPPPTDAEFRAATRDVIRKMASAEEIHYSTHRTYTAELDSLKSWQKPESMDVDVQAANARGWSAVFSSPALDRICALGYGGGIPGGWTPGMVLCAPPRAAAAP
jgi:hypothetical protein